MQSISPGLTFIIVIFGLGISLNFCVFCFVFLMVSSILSDLKSSRQAFQNFSFADHFVSDFPGTQCTLWMFSERGSRQYQTSPAHTSWAGLPDTGLEQMRQAVQLLKAFMNASLILASEAFEMGQGRTSTFYPTAPLYTIQEVTHYFLLSYIFKSSLLMIPPK